MHEPDPTPHPSEETWTSFLYRETTPAQHRELADHLQQCPTCRARVAAWQDTMTVLDQWKQPVSRKTALRMLRPVRWAAAALLLLGLGMAAGRWLSPPADLSALRAGLLPILREEVRRDLQHDLVAAVQLAADQTDQNIADVVESWARSRDQDQRSFLAWRRQAESQRTADLAWIRRDLETLALNANEQFDTTHQALGQLARISQSSPSMP